MKGILGIFLVLILGIFMLIPASAFSDRIAGIDLGVSLPDGVYCEINEVKLSCLQKKTVKRLAVLLRIQLRQK